MASFYFFEVGGWLIFGFKSFPPMSLNSFKLGFPDKMTSLWAFELQLSYQKYQGPPIVVGYVCLELQQQLNTVSLRKNFGTVWHIEFQFTFLRLAWKLFFLTEKFWKSQFEENKNKKRPHFFLVLKPSLRFH